MEQWTIKKLLDWITSYFMEKDVDSPRLSGELLLCHILGLQRIELYTLFDRVVEQAKLDALRGLVKRASEHEPISYLVQRCEFYSLSFKVTPACLIPRPETELLVEKAIGFLRQKNGTQQVLDLCTGSGCIATAIAKNVPDAQIIATDLSSDALQIAEENIQRHNLQDRIALINGDLFESIEEGSRFDLIVSNPPYISQEEYDKLDRNVKEYEPETALYGGSDGLDYYRQIITQVEQFLKPGAAIMLEIGYNQGIAVKELFLETGVFKEIQILKDLSQQDRIAIAKLAAA